jgi:DNA-binding CsgD family transcriptional regulator
MKGEITSCEIRCLELVAQGFYAKEIADIIGRSKRTVESQLASGRRKLGGRTIAHAIAVACQKNLILSSAGGRYRGEGDALDG